MYFIGFLCDAPQLEHECELKQNDKSSLKLMMKLKTYGIHFKSAP